MPHWIPSLTFKGEDVVIIGGGSSLQNFPFEQLRGSNVIGCNDAFRLGHDLVPYIIFGDQSFWNTRRDALKAYAEAGGNVVSCATVVLRYNLPWAFQMSRVMEGLCYQDNCIGWNYSTGAAAINLALRMGAARVFLLGYDCGRRASDKRTHWHNHSSRHIEDATYLRFMKGFENVARALKGSVPVFNVTDGSSQLNTFPRISFPTFWESIKQPAGLLEA